MRWSRGCQKLEYNRNRNIMLPYRNNKQNNQASSKRKTKQGDWVCMRCANYNYSFRSICNRCRAQSREQNHSAITHLPPHSTVLPHSGLPVGLLVGDGCGENLFPSALFLKLDPLRAGGLAPGPLKEGDRPDKAEELGGLRENKWIHNLINQ